MKHEFKFNGKAAEENPIWVEIFNDMMKSLEEGRK